MSEQELNDLAAETAPEPEAEIIPPEQPAQDGARDGRPEAASAGPDVSRAALDGACTIVVKGLGRLITRRAKVSDLTPEEAAMVGKAAADVAVLYDWHLSEKAAAWLGLGMAVVAVSAPRIEEYDARRVMPTENEASPDGSEGDLEDYPLNAPQTPMQAGGLEPARDQAA